MAERALLVDLLLLRGHVLGRIADYERAAELAELLVRDAPDDGAAWLARARTRATFHRFAEALADLDAAGRCGADRATLDAERAAILQAVGCYAEALVLRRTQRSAGPTSRRWVRWPCSRPSAGRSPRRSACSPRRGAATGVSRRSRSPRSTSGAD